MGVSLKYLRCKKEASMSGINEETDVGKDIVGGGTQNGVMYSKERSLL